MSIIYQIVKFFIALFFSYWLILANVLLIVGSLAAGYSWYEGYVVFWQLVWQCIHGYFFK